TSRSRNTRSKRDCSSDVCSSYLFAHNPVLLKVVKWYVHHQLTINKFSTAKRNYDGITMFIKFVDEYVPELESFSELSQDLLIMYFEYLMNEKSETTGKTLSKVSIKKGDIALNDILFKDYS